MLKLIYNVGDYDHLNKIINLLGLKNIFVSYLYECFRKGDYSWSFRQKNCWKKSTGILVSSTDPVFNGNKHREIEFSILCSEFDKYLFSKFLLNKEYKDTLEISDEDFDEITDAVTKIHNYVSKCTNGIFSMAVYEGIVENFGKDFGDEFTFESLLIAIKFIKALITDKIVDKYAYKSITCLMTTYASYNYYSDVFKEKENK